MDTSVKWENSEHNKKLRELFILFTGEKEFPGQSSKEWKRLGFQGKDPVTDFRGMGEHGLDVRL